MRHRGRRRLVEHAEPRHCHEEQCPPDPRDTPAPGADRDIEAVEQPGEHRDARERDHDRDAVPRAHTSEAHELQGPAEPTLGAEEERAHHDDAEPGLERPAPPIGAADGTHEHGHDGADESDRGGHAQLRGSEPLAARFVEAVGQRRERTEPVRGDRAEELDEPERIRLRHSQRTVGNVQQVLGVLQPEEQRREVGERRGGQAHCSEERGDAQPARSALRERAHDRANGKEREEKREVIDPRDPDEHTTEEQPAQVPPRASVPQRGERRQRRVGPEHFGADQHDDRHSYVEREILVRGAVAEVIRGEREQHRADQSRRPRAPKRPQRGKRGQRRQRKREEPEQVERERDVAGGVDQRLLHRVREEIAAHRPLGPMLREGRVELGVRVEPAGLVDVLDQHHVERGVLLVVARRLRVLKRDVQRQAPQMRHERHREAREERGEQRAGDQRMAPVPVPPGRPHLGVDCEILRPHHLPGKLARRRSPGPARSSSRCQLDPYFSS